jgi:hypothetical protein
MEYYLALVNYLSCADPEDIDEFELMMHRKEIREYLKSVKKDNIENPYLKQIANWCNQEV